MESERKKQFSMDQNPHFFFDSSVTLRGGRMSFIGNTDDIYRGTGIRNMLNLEETSRKRPFFSSPEELYDEEYYDEQSPEKKRRLTAEQVHLLEKNFAAENKLEPERKIQLAKKLGLQPRQVAVWFQNRRARWKTKQLERDYDDLKSSYDSLATTFDSVVKENEKLKSQVASLTEKLQAKPEGGTEEKPGQKADPLPAEIITVSAFQHGLKVEDRLSSGSGRSAMVDEDAPQLVDSGDSHFPGVEFYRSMGPGPVDGIQSEEDDGSDDGRSYFPDPSMFAATGQQEEQHEATLDGLWMWSN